MTTTMTNVLRATCCCLAIALATACGDDGAVTDAGVDAGEMIDAGGDAGGMCTEFTPEYCPRVYPMSPVAINTICEVFADMFCRANGNCCDRPDEVYPTFAECTSDQISRCMDTTTGFEHAASLANSALDYNSAALGEQRAMLGTMSDSCSPVRFGDAIEASMRGRIAAGAECAVSEECMDGASCRMGAETLTCQARLANGGSCTRTDECTPSLQCVDGSCAARLEDGEACADDDECASEHCVDGACVEATGDIVYCVRQGVAGRAFER